MLFTTIVIINMACAVTLLTEGLLAQVAWKPLVFLLVVSVIVCKLDELHITSTRCACIVFVGIFIMFTIFIRQMVSLWKRGSIDKTINIIVVIIAFCNTQNMFSGNSLALLFPGRLKSGFSRSLQGMLLL